MPIFRSISKPGAFPPRIDKSIEMGLSLIQLSATKIAEFSVTALKRITPSRTGFMRSNVRYWGLRLGSRGGFCFRLGWRKKDFLSQKVFYPPYVVYGTGIYGVKKRRIFPKQARRLVWVREGRWISARSIAGQKPQKLFDKVVPNIQRFVRTIVQDAMVSGFKRS